MWQKREEGKEEEERQRDREMTFGEERNAY